MSFIERIRQVDELRAAIAAHGPLPADALKKVNYKFRLEWNYTSNSMEGNSLSRSETRSVMIGNITVHGKPIKDVMEMKGHDDVILSVLKMGAGELQLSEKRIRDIHRGIMHEDDPEKMALIGRWKTQDNYLHNYRNERIDFTPHAEVSGAMHRLTDWLSAQREKIARGEEDALHPVVMAFRFHLDYVSIHPFYDGNGRTARILTNIILIAYGYPPVWIREHERDTYHQYLADVQAYGGSPDVFYDFMAGLLLRSQQLMLDAVEGKEIEEIGDLDKKIALLKKRLRISHTADAGLSYHPELVAAIFEASVMPFAEAWEKRLQSFDGFFERRKVWISSDTHMDHGRGPVEALSAFYSGVVAEKLHYDIRFDYFKLDCDFTNLISVDKPAAINGGGVKFAFHDNRYEIVPVDSKQHAINKLYGEQLLEAEIVGLVEYLGNWVYNNIELFLQGEAAGKNQ